MCTVQWNIRHSTTTGFIQKSNLHRTCGITPKLVTSGGAYIHGLALGQYSSEETSLRWLDVAGIVSDLTDPGIKPQTCTEV